MYINPSTTVGQVKTSNFNVQFPSITLKKLPCHLVQGAPIGSRLPPSGDPHILMQAKDSSTTCLSQNQTFVSALEPAEILKHLIIHVNLQSSQQKIRKTGHLAQRHQRQCFTPRQ